MIFKYLFGLIFGCCSHIKSMPTIILLTVHLIYVNESIKELLISLTILDEL